MRPRPLWSWIWNLVINLVKSHDLNLANLLAKRHFWLSPFRVCSTNGSPIFLFPFCLNSTTRCIKKDSFKVLLSYITAANKILSICKKAVDKIEEILKKLFYSNSRNCGFDILAQLAEIFSEVLLLFECNAPVILRDFYETFLIHLNFEGIFYENTDSSNWKWSLKKIQTIRLSEVSLSPKRLNFLTEIAKFGFLK